MPQSRRSPISYTNTSSGTVRVTIHPCSNWLAISAEIAITLVVAYLLFRDWRQPSLPLRAFFIVILVAAALDFYFRLSRTQIIEFDSTKLTISTDLRGWNRKKEYPIQDCRELEWSPASGGSRSALTCRLDRNTILLAKDITEDESIEIVFALRQAYPEIAKTLVADPFQPKGRDLRK